MYILARVSDDNARRLSAIAKRSNTSVAALSGALLAKFLSGELKLVTKENVPSPQGITRAPGQPGRVPHL